MYGMGSNGSSRKLWRGEKGEKERGGMINNGWVEKNSNYVTSPIYIQEGFSVEGTLFPAGMYRRPMFFSCVCYTDYFAGTRYGRKHSTYISQWKGVKHKNCHGDGTEHAITFKLAQIV
jgi:hypothetical protein